MNQSPSPTLQVLIREALERHRAGNLAEAERLYRQALTLDPHHADCLHLLGLVAFQSGQHAQAAALIRRAIALYPDAVSYHSNLGNVLQAEGNLVAAEACYRRALELNPKQAETHLNLGHNLKAQGDVSAALASYRRAIQYSPDMAEARVAESTALLLQGDFAAGWQGFERRWQTRDYDTPMRSYAQPQWRGQPLTSGRLLVWGEQGIGDEILFAGLMADLERAGIRCVLDCDPRLKPLFTRSFPRVEVVSGCDANRAMELDIEAHLPTGSLPSLFRANRESFTASRTYLAADAVKQEQFRIRYGDEVTRIGLAWHTSNKKSGSARSISLSQLAPLFSFPSIRWISLQYGDHAMLEEQAAAACAPLLVDREVDQLVDIDSFAAQVASMDLVIAIDNSAAHLAAALGVRTWLLLPFAPDWRWQISGDCSPWYPSMRIFRQSAVADWQSVALQVRNALAANLTTIPKR